MSSGVDAIYEASDRINFVPCVKWVRRGVAKAVPEKVQLTKEELIQVIKQTKTKLRNESSGDEETDQAGAGSANQDEFNFEQYDEEADAAGLAIGNMATAEEGDAHSDTDSEKDDDVIKPDDNLILVGHVEGDASVLEVYVYNQNEGSLYVHHDFLLPSFPLCLEWLDYEPGHDGSGSLCAVGSMTPVIEIWDLDIVNCLEAAFSLGQLGSRRKRMKQIGHTDAVLDLAWNKSFHHILASCSVDKTVLLWDLDQGVPHTTLKVFEDKVQCLKWHQFEAQTLLAGSCDKTVRVFDCRGDSTHQSWTVDGEVERVLWDPLEPFCFFSATSAGSVHCFDCRKGLVWSLPAHEKEVSGIIISEQCRGLMVTTSGDGTMKTWDYTLAEAPRMVHSQEMKMGALHCLESCPDLPFVVASGGDNKSNHFSVLDLRTIDPIKHQFEKRPLVELVAAKTQTPDADMESLSINNA